eukprot:5806649-Pleurochrysis_carterae.AAC.1
MVSSATTQAGLRPAAVGPRTLARMQAAWLSQSISISVNEVHIFISFAEAHHTLLLAGVWESWQV